MEVHKDDQPFCGICFEEGPNDAGEPLLSGCCSCRGSAGHFHADCVIKYAKVKTTKAVKYGRSKLLYGIWYVSDSFVRVV